jgi:GT2 family glycosyltransferase
MTRFDSLKAVINNDTDSSSFPNDVAMRPSVDIVIVNWNAGEQLRDCLRSINTAQRKDWILSRVVVIDNASSDDSIVGVSAEATNLPLSVIRNCTNHGFGRACNQGAIDSKADYILFLNPDVRLDSDAIVVPLKFMSAPENTSVGICGIQLYDETNEVSRSCRRFPSAWDLVAEGLGLHRLVDNHRMDDWNHDSNMCVEQVIGAFFLIRRKLFEELNGFDERFFVYFEEVDLSLRANRAGWSSWYLASARAMHVGGGCTSKAKSSRIYYAARSRMQYARKHFTKPIGSLVVAATLFVEPVARLSWSAIRRSGSDAKDTLGAYRLLWSDIVRTLWERRLSKQ